MNAAIIYFHGIPGSAEELTLFGPEVAQRTADFDVVARQHGSHGADSAYFDVVERTRSHSLQS